MRQNHLRIILIALATTLSACGQSTGVGTSGLTAGSGSGGSSSGSTACTTCRIFSTAMTSQGNFGSVAAADAVCAADSNKPNSSTYKAVVWGIGRQAPSTDWPIRSGVTYVRSDGTTVISTGNSDGSLAIPLTNSIITTANTYHWTGIDISLYTTLSAHPNNCNGWTDNSNGTTGATGTGSLAASGAYIGMVTAGGRACDGSYHFYCVEQ